MLRPWVDPTCSFCASGVCDVHVPPGYRPAKDNSWWDDADKRDREKRQEREREKAAAGQAEHYGAD